MESNHRRKPLPPTVPRCCYAPRRAVLVTARHNVVKVARRPELQRRQAEVRGCARGLSHSPLWLAGVADDGVGYPLDFKGVSPNVSRASGRPSSAVIVSASSTAGTAGLWHTRRHPTTIFPALADRLHGLGIALKMRRAERSRAARAGFVIRGLSRVYPVELPNTMERDARRCCAGGWVHYAQPGQPLRQRSERPRRGACESKTREGVNGPVQQHASRRRERSQRPILRRSARARRLSKGRCCYGRGV